MDRNKDKHREMLAEADRFVAAAVPRVAQDEHRLNYHFMAPAYWMNDPNGFSFYKGQYHLFYQHYPFDAASTFSFKYWGHAVSDDLVSWKHLPIALAPSEAYEVGGCWSGCAVDDNGKLTLLYTGHVDANSPKEVQAIAFSEDGIHFEKYPGNPIIAAPPVEASEDFRDPKVWLRDGVWYMIVGTGKDGIGKVVLYRSQDLLQWTYIGVLAESDGTQGHMWECPDIFELDGKDVLIISPIGMASHKNIAIIGKLDYELGRFTQENVQELDFGPDFYAAATLEDQRGRRIMIAWMDMWGNPMPTVERDWAGAMTIPRVLSLNEKGFIRTSPVPEMQKLRGELWSVPAFLLTSEKTDLLDEIQGDSYEIIAEFQLSPQEAASGHFGFKVRCSSANKEETVIRFEPAVGKLIVDTELAGAGLKVQSCAPAVADEDHVLKLHLFVDRSSLEVFVNEGDAALSCRIYPSSGSLGLDVFSVDYPVLVRRLDIWKLEKANS